MMIYRLSMKLAEKIDCLDCLNDIPIVDNPFTDWSAHLFRVQRIQYIIVSNTTSLYSVLMYGRGITDHDDFIKGVRNAMRMYMEDDGKEKLYNRFIESDDSPIMFAKALNRSVTGSMNDLIKGVKFHLKYDELPLFDVAQRINETPLSCLNGTYPTEAFVALAQDSTS